MLPDGICMGLANVGVVWLVRVWLVWVWLVWVWLVCVWLVKAWIVLPLMGQNKLGVASMPCYLMASTLSCTLWLV